MIPTYRNILIKYLILIYPGMIAININNIGK